ncbi:MAG: nucleotidyl transferase AbiEii/AbiGii toxin family protein [Anaerolineae bacterium]
MSPQRGKPRDLYDIWLLPRQGVEPDPTLVEHKLALYGRGWKREALEEAVENLRAEWERDLRPLLPQFVPCEVVQGDVEARLS